MKEHITHEGEPRLFEAFGYDGHKQDLARRANKILQNGAAKVFEESLSIYGKTLSAYATGALTPEDMREFASWATLTQDPPMDALLRLAVCIDFAHQMREEYESDATARALFLGMKAEFHDRAMAEAIHRVQPEDIGLVHDAFQEIVDNDKADLFYSDTGEYSGLTKYFGTSAEKHIFKNRKGAI